MVNLAEAQKVFNLVQGLSKQRQFVKYISNAGLLSVLLESLTKGNGAGATFLVPSPDALQSLPPASPYFNNPALARTTLRYHMILGKQMDYTALVERPADTGFPTLAKESVFKSDESAFFTVVFRSGSGRSTSTLLAPNLAKTEFFQVHLVDSLLVPDAILHSMPGGGDAAGAGAPCGLATCARCHPALHARWRCTLWTRYLCQMPSCTPCPVAVMLLVPVHLVDSLLVPDAILHSMPGGGDAAGAVPSPSVPSPPLNPSPPSTTVPSSPPLNPSPPPTTVPSSPPVNPSPPPPSPSPPLPESPPPLPVSSPPTPDSSSPTTPTETTPATTPPSPSPPPPTSESTSPTTPPPP
ncbi:unnamed protein product [Closterium sp. Naga37s-1]|nr:unnamed protein product [Closterium sp. Naga37s-1]